MLKRITTLIFSSLILFQCCNSERRENKIPKIIENMVVEEEKKNTLIPNYYYFVTNFYKGIFFYECNNNDTGYLFRALTIAFDGPRSIVIELIKYIIGEGYSGELYNSYKLYREDFKKALDTQQYYPRTVEYVKWINSKKLILCINQLDTFVIDLTNYEQDDIQVRKYNKGVDNTQ